jgi:hypothetical protein
VKDAPEEELTEALAALSAKRRGVGRWDARAVLIPLGRLLLARGEEGVRVELERVRAAAAPHAAAWEAAVREELSLACAEHVQGTDPRYLGVPGFDWGYVLSARERLEARVRAARALGLEPPAALWAGVLEADRRVRSRRGAAPGGSPG